MKRQALNIFIIITCLLLRVSGTNAQENKGSIGWNPQLFDARNDVNSRSKTTALSLPFFEDFTDYDLYPNGGRWTDNQVYINNTMCSRPISRGVATFDALNAKGLPWNPFSNGDFSFADSLTSQPIDLSSYNASDSVYLSFFYQPQGRGYAPLVGDTFFVFMKITYGDWLPVWKIRGSAIQPFQQVMIPITDTLYFHNNFQFRFVNIAAFNSSDANWNLDYIRLDAHRNMNDTAVNDVAFTADPGFMLNDYTSMPYRQFYAYPTGERTMFINDTLRNNTATMQPVTYGYSARALNTGTVLKTAVMQNTNLIPRVYEEVKDSTYTTTITPGGIYDKVVFENKYFIQSTSGTGTIPNDTIIKNQVFDNYLAYDDGTAEQSYYLTLYPSLPGKIEIEHHLNIPDTMQGMAIYFGRQVPNAAYKIFDIEVYSALAGINGAAADNVLYRQESCNPGYADTINHFWYYKFDTPLPLRAGTFYTGAFMPAGSGADSLYFGLDVNRIGGNHAYYKVAATWNPSLIHGAIMMRPLFGQHVAASTVPTTTKQPARNWQVTPNPATDKLTFNFPGDVNTTFRIMNVQGQIMLSGSIESGNSIDISTLKEGMYFVNIYQNGLPGAPQNIIKL